MLKQTNYQTKFSLSKAFRNHFGMPMPVYRMKFKVCPKKDPVSGYFDLQPLIKKMNAKRTICIDMGVHFKNRESYFSLWKKLIHCKHKHLRQKQAQYISISLDNPAITPLKFCRFYNGFLADEQAKAESGFCIQEIPGGTFAFFNHTGNNYTFPLLYRNMYEEWMPRHQYCQIHPLTFELYANTSEEAAIQNLITEIYIPVQSIK